MLQVILWFVLLSTSSASITTISRKCSQLVQNPNSESTFEMLKRTLDVNCFHHFHVNVEKQTMRELQLKYEDAVNASVIYEAAASANEQTLYRAKTWLSMAAADPLSLGQRQAKECNAQILSSYFGNEDVATTLPVFIQSLDYMHECFQDVLQDARDLKVDLLQEYENRVQEVRAAAERMHETYEGVTETRLELNSMRSDFADSVIDTYNSIYS